jgi:hypothetical protein
MASTLNLTDVLAYILRTVHTISLIYTAVLNNEDFFVWEPLGMVLEHPVKSLRPDWGMVIMTQRSLHELLDTVRPQGADPPIVVEADEVLFANTLWRTQKCWQFPCHTEVPPVTGKGSRKDAIELEERVKDPRG